MGQIITQDNKIARILKEKKELIEKARELSKQIETLEQERNKIALKVQKLKDKVVPFAKKIKKDQLGRYEDIQTIDLVGENIVITTFDYVEEYKKVLEEKIKKG